MSEAGWQKLNEIFAAALGLEPAAQDNFLRQIEDESLRREAEAMLAATRQADAKGFLNADAFQVGARILAEVENKSLTEGKLIGSYRLIREIGRGGMGTVFLAEREDFRQQVALKIIKRGMDTDNIVRRFRRERQVLASLNHPNIARLFDGGTTERDIPFFVMEYVEGLPVTEFCDRQKLSIEERLRLFCKVCAAVAYAHQNFIIHRDLKPSNILVSKNGEPKLLDFGISKLLASDSFETTIEQTTGVRLLTPEYASPEQIRGGPITTASDIYMLGVLLYKLLCGRLPFSLKNLPPVEILKIASEREPLAPSAAVSAVEEIALDEITGESRSPETVADLCREHPDKLRRRLRGDLDNIVLKTLRKEPERRYESVEQLSEDIERHLTGRPIMARPAAISYHAAKFIRRNRTAVTFATLLALLVITIGVSWSYFFWRSGSEKSAPQTVAHEDAPRTIAVLPFHVVGGGADREALGADLTDTLIARLGRIEELEVRPSSAVASFANKDALAAGKDLRVEAVLESRLEGTGESVRVTSRLLKTNDGQVLWSGTFDEKLADVSTAQDMIAERVAGVLLGQLTVEQRKKVKKRYTDNPEAYKLYLKGKYALGRQNEESLKRSIQYFNQALDVDPGYALAHAGIADVYFGLSGVYVNPHEAFPKAKAAALRALELDPELAEARAALAVVLSSYDWNWSAADAEFERAIKLNPNYAAARHWYARHLAFQKRRAEAIAQFKRARELDPLSPYISLDSSLPDFFDNKYDRAIEQTNRATEIDDRFWFAYWVRGWAYQQQGNIVAAIADYKKAQAIENSTTIQAFLANVYAVTGRHREARKIISNLLELRKKQYVGAPSIAAVYAGLGDKEQALAWLEKGYQDRDEWMIWMKFDHRYDNLRSDARFQDLLRRVGLP